MRMAIPGRKIGNSFFNETKKYIRAGGYGGRPAAMEKYLQKTENQEPLHHLQNLGGPTKYVPFQMTQTHFKLFGKFPILHIQKGEPMKH